MHADVDFFLLQSSSSNTNNSSNNSRNQVKIAPVQLHAFILGAFASLIAPFGGFFASGLKRAFKLKDFGDLIPGHGGMTDRMDCQVIMGAFTFMYLNFVVFPPNWNSNNANVNLLATSSTCPTDVAELTKCVQGLSHDQKALLFANLKL